ncbi:MAG: choice-of-anchor L domain-containing protein, partial [Planctomycetes bacterium]|nr:choice-of-anchor L domain-containing protein [Planctomycetota bacterium]
GLGIESGVILTCGNASYAPGLDPLQPGVNISDGASASIGGSGDADLEALIAPTITNDAAVLEFDFVSKGGSIYFKYVFASEEYNEFVYMFNDVFAFFLDGQNIALIPGTSTPVSVDNINGGNPFGTNPSNQDLYNNNDISDGGPFFANEYDGFTHVLVAQAINLSPGTHHIKLAIADALDTILDSAVFIQAGSFSDTLGSGPPILSENPDSLPGWNPASRFGDPNMVVWDPNSYNINTNPLFSRSYYLSHIATGQIADSPAIDAGSGLATSFGLGDYTTRLDGVVEGYNNVVDMGYHYTHGAPQYTLSVTVAENPDAPGIHGSVVLDPSGGKYLLDELVVVRAVPDIGYFVKGWYDEAGNLVSTADSIDVVMDSDKVFTVQFRLPVEIEVHGGGTALLETVGQAGNGDTIIVYPGVYIGGINPEGKQLVIVGAVPDDPDVVGQTIIDGFSVVRAFTFENGEGSKTVVKGLTIINGNGGSEGGGAVYVGPGSSPTLTGLVIRDCIAASGGAIYIGSGSSPTISRVTISNCRASSSGGAIYVGWASNPDIENVRITGCSAGSNGGAVFVNSDANAVFRKRHFVSCWANGGSGGAVYAMSNSVAAFVNCLFDDNSAMLSGGAVHYSWNCQSQFFDCEFTGNTVVGGGSLGLFGGNGGAILYSSDNVTTIADCNFIASSAEIGGALYFFDNCSGSIVGTALTENLAGTDGGAIYMSASAGLQIYDCSIVDNKANRGGGVFSMEGAFDIVGSSILRNEATLALNAVVLGGADPNGSGGSANVYSIDYGFGGGIFCFASDAYVADCDISENAARGSGGGVYLAGGPGSAGPISATPEFTNCLITKNIARRDGGGISSDWYANTRISNCTLSDNRVTGVHGYGGGLYCAYESYTVVTDSIIWDNRGINGSQLALANGGEGYPLPSALDITYTDIGPAYDPNDYLVEMAPVDPSPDTGPIGDGSVLIEAQTIYDQFDAGQTTVKVIVSLSEPDWMSKSVDWDSDESVGALRAEASNRQSTVIGSLTSTEFTLRHLYENQAAFSGEITLDGLNELLADPMVVAIEPVRELEPHMAQAIALGNALQARQLYDGTGISIAIVDTGIDYTHPMLGGGGFPNVMVIGGYDTGMGDSDPMPFSEPHGTCVAGIAAGDLGTVGDYIGGVAPGAKLYALKANPDGWGIFFSDSLLAAWDWCITHQDDDPENPIMVINNSLGGGLYDNAEEADASSPAMTVAAAKAVSAGITILASSGNSYSTWGIGWPAAMSDVISVGAVYDTTDEVTEYSNTATILDILAPADPVYTTDIVGLGGYDPGDYFPYFGGTSSACPFAAGVVASLQSAAVKKLGAPLSPALIRNTLVGTGDPVTDTKIAITKPRVNLGAAIASLSGGIPIYIEDGCVLNGEVIYDFDPNSFAWDPNSFNIEEDPLFILDYYLSQIDAGQLDQSPCVDVGSLDADELSSRLGLELTTRTNHLADVGTIGADGDAGRVDMGYHYDASEPVEEYTLTITVIGDGGTIASPWQPGTYVLTQGTMVQLTSLPDPNHIVEKWTGTDDDASPEPTHIVTMDADKVVTIEFILNLPRNLLVPLVYPTIAEAVEASRSGDTVVLTTGIHYIAEPDGIDFDGKAITLRSTNPDDVWTVDNTVIDCQGSRYLSKRAFHFHNGEGNDSRVMGVTITNGFMAGAVGASFSIPGEPWPPNQTPEAPPRANSGRDAVGDGYGGAIFCENGSSPTIEKC